MVSSTRTSVTQQRDDEEVGEPALVLDRCPSAFPDEQRVHVGVIERPHDVGGPVDAEHRVARSWREACRAEFGRSPAATKRSATVRSIAVGSRRRP